MSYFCVNHSDMKTTQEIITILRYFKMTEGDRYGISRLGIFGSVARGEQTSDSDVDVFFEGKTVGLFALSHLKNELERLLGCSVDIVRLREHMNAALHKRIEKEGLYV